MDHLIDKTVKQKRARLQRNLFQKSWNQNTFRFFLRSCCLQCSLRDFWAGALITEPKNNISAKTMTAWNTIQTIFSFQYVGHGWRVKNIDELDIAVNTLMDLPLLFKALSTGSTWGKYQILGVREQAREFWLNMTRGRSARRIHHVLVYTKYAMKENLWGSRRHVIFEYVMINSLFYTSNIFH